MDAAVVESAFEQSFLPRFVSRPCARQRLRPSMGYRRNPGVTWSRKRCSNCGENAGL